MTPKTRMSDEELHDDDDEKLGELDDEELGELDEAVEVDDVDSVVKEDDEKNGKDDTAIDDTPPRAKSRKRRRKRHGEDNEDDEALDLDEELHPDDVEVPLDVVLRERTASPDEEEEDEAEEATAKGGRRVVPRREGEFLCSSCFLVLPLNQLADQKRRLCRDCA